MKNSGSSKGRFLKVDNELEQLLRKIFKSQKGNDSLPESSYDNESEVKEEINESKLLINALSFKKYHFSEQDKQEVWNNINLHNKQHELNEKVLAAQSQRRSYPWLKVASVFIILFSIVSLFVLINSRMGQQTIATHFGETKEITLPDGSNVVLNANSILKYSNENPREVWIQGEAFFSVVHTKDDRKFVVKTMDDLSVLVLGTTFNVYNRQKKVKIVLNTGKIKLQREGKNSLDMSPGELAEFKNLDNYYIKEVDPALYTSWTHKKLIFKNTSVRELAELIEDTYGFTVTIPEKNLEAQKISGTIVNENLEGLLMAISETLDLQVIKTSKEITLKNKPK